MEQESKISISFQYHMPFLRLDGGVLPPIVIPHQWEYTWIMWEWYGALSPPITFPYQQ